jgi:hypothetical protein
MINNGSFICCYVTILLQSNKSYRYYESGFEGQHSLQKWKYSEVLFREQLI